MNYVVRIYLDNEKTDISLEKRSSFSIGSSWKDDYVIIDPFVKATHINFIKEGKGWKIKCKGEVFLGRERIKTKVLSAGETFIVEGERKIAISILMPPKDRNSEVNIAHVGKISIGRNNNCEIVFKNKKVSSVHAIIYKIGNEYHISDNKSTNGTYVNDVLVKNQKLEANSVINIGPYEILFSDNKLLLYNSDEDIQINNIVDQRPIEGSKNYPYIKRSPRVKTKVSSSEVEIQAAPSIGSKPEINWLSVLLMPGAMMLSGLLLSGRTAGLSLITAPVSVALSVSSYLSQKKKHSNSEKLRLDKYDDYLKNTVNEIESKADEQLQACIQVHPETQECVRIVKNMERRLWERTLQDSDFMSLRVGSGSIELDMKLRAPKETISLEEDALLSKPREIMEKYKKISRAPIVVDILNDGSVGIVGNRKDNRLLLKNIIVQAVTHHCYDELKIVTIFSEAEMAEWEWIRWLPHSFSDDKSERYMAYNAYGANQLFRKFEEEFSQRERDIKEEDDYDNKDFLAPFYLFVVTDRSLIENQEIMKYLLANNRKFGVGVLFLYDDISLLPRACNVIIDVQNRKGVIFHKENISTKEHFNIDKVNSAEFDHFARSLAPIKTDTKAEEGILPTHITFLEGYGVKKPEQINIAQNWENGRTHKSMAVPIGVKVNGAPFLFDIHEKYHGPHGLVAGMTGSGKSEMVQSWILSMALKFSPQRVSFVLIDFKGTGLILPFMNMPHLAGTISDLDTNINRNLIALENELSRRKALLDSVGVNNINGYLKLYEEGKTKEPLSFLFIVIDEFAEFKVQFPDFMVVVNRIFAIGRTLGVFAILLTQKPSGVVDDKMHANTRFRWCLKVASSADSKEMLRHPDAAKITNPGRAYVQVGEDEIFELVQSYWSGAPYKPNPKSHSQVMPMVSVVDINGNRILYGDYEKTVNYKSETNEIDAIIKYLDQYVKEKEIPSAKKIWTQKLSEKISLNSIIQESFNGNDWPDNKNLINPVVGMLDDPYAQSQYPLQVNFSEDGHFVVYGAPGTGKTTLLQTLIVSLILSYSPQQVNIYIMDFGGWSMGLFKDFPHVGGVALDNDNEGIEKTARLITKELDERKRKFAAIGVGNITSYQEATNEILPTIILVLDNFAPVTSLYPDLEPFFISLTREGGNYGIYFATSANVPMTLGYRLGQNIKAGVSLQMADRSDYSSIVGKTNGLEPEKWPGRGLAKGTATLEFQTALPANGENESERVRNIKKLAETMNEKWIGPKARPIPIMPAIINFERASTKDICIGLTTTDVEPVTISFAGQHYIIISGRAMSGKSNMQKVIAKQFDGEIVACDLGSGGLKTIEEIATSFILSPSDFDTYMEKLVPILQNRRAEYMQDNSAIFSPILIMIDDLKQCFELVTDETIKRLDAIIRLGKGLNVNLLVAGNNDEIAKLYNQGEPFTMGLVQAQTNILLGGSFKAHHIFKADIPYSLQDTSVDEHEGYVIYKETAKRFKGMNEI